jgi:hypothetical protein
MFAVFVSSVQRLFRFQGGRAQSGAQLGARSERHRNPRKCTEPGPVRTPFLLDFAGEDPVQQQGMLDDLGTRVPLGRVGEPDEIARAALFLASSDASFVNGAELFADGGQAQV